MRIANDVWIEGPYYIEFDVHGQLCIVGPGNHLHFGSVGLYNDTLSIQSAQYRGGVLTLQVEIQKHELVWQPPVIGHIRKVRDLIERPGEPRPTFEAVMRQHPEALVPNFVSTKQNGTGYTVVYRRHFLDSWYGNSIRFDPTATATELVGGADDGAVKVTSDSGVIQATITAETSSVLKPGITRVLTSATLQTAHVPAADETEQLLRGSAVEIEHLIGFAKTSGFDYGTVFPRDWMEAGDLGTGDFSAKALAYIYHKSLQHVDPEGEGWHEDIIGEFKAERESEYSRVIADMEELLENSDVLTVAMRAALEQSRRLLVVRNMIDIEPHYILGARSIDAAAWSERDRQRLVHVAGYVIRQATENRLITFKKLPSNAQRTSAPQYYGAGNWRDSEEAYLRIDPVIAPYDVNAVFYPLALAVIADNPKLFTAEHAEAAAKLRPKWDAVADLYRFRNDDGTDAFALALYGVDQSGSKLKYNQLKVNHTDEAYDHFYGAPNEADTVAFCRRLLTPEHFYTASGPTVVGASDGYTTLQYHGRVIWTKQTAFVIAGLYRSYQRARTERWQKASCELLADTITKTTEASLAAYRHLGMVPELHFDNDGVATPYNQQPHAEGPMNKVQLWSAVGARRIISTYESLLSVSDS